VDEELRWFFSVHDGRRGSPFFEELAAQRHAELPETYAREARVYRQIRERLLALSDHDAGVLKAAYTPMPWPPKLRHELGRLTGVVVRFASVATEGRSETSEQEILEVMVARRLDLALVTVGREVFAAYRTPARALLKRALTAYASVRDGEATAGRRRA
jgi:hypothetical protein